MKKNSSTVVSPEDIERNIFIKKVEEGLAQLKSRQTFMHEEVKQKVREWTSDKIK